MRIEIRTKDDNSYFSDKIYLDDNHDEDYIEIEFEGITKVVNKKEFLKAVKIMSE